MTESAAPPTIWTLTNTHERQRNLRCCYTDCYTTSRRYVVIAVSPRPSANAECRVLEHQPVGPRPRPGGEQRPLPFRGMTHVVHPRGSPIEDVWPGCVYAWLGTSATVEGLARGRACWAAGQIGNRPTPINGCPQRIPDRTWALR